MVCNTIDSTAAEIISPYLYVAPYGDDSNPGTESKPFATLARARDAVRELKAGIPKPVTVLLREGIYYLSEPVVFEPEDSGTLLQPITYAAYPGEKPTISGGVKLDARWEHYKDGIMKCSIPAGIVFDQLFINGKRQMRARYPNFDPLKPLVGEGGYITAVGADNSVPEIFFDPETFTKKKWANPSEAIVHIFPGAYWNNIQHWVKDIDWDRNAILFGQGGWQTFKLDTPEDFSGATLYKGSHYFIENVFEELDSHGEWYLDRKKSILYYKPPEGMDINDATVEAGLLKRLIEVIGSRRSPVRYITFKGLRFTHTATTFLDEYESPSTGDWGIHRGGAVFLDGVEDCSLENCYFDALGGNGLFISNHNRRIRVYGNTFAYLGDSAVCLVGKSHVETTGSLPCPICGAIGWWDFGPDPEDYSTGCVISNNLIHHIGVYGKQTAGVFMATAMKNIISHNHIHHVPRAAICINDPFWGGHIIEYNDIHDTVLETNDHGTFNSWGRGHYWCVAHYDAEIYHEPGDVKQDAKFTTVIRNNRIRENVTEAQNLSYGSSNMGIDMDDGSANYHVYNNLCIGVGVQNRDGSHRIIENNIFINPNKGISYHVGYINSGDRFVKNIVTQEKNHNYFWILLQTDEGSWIDEIDNNVFYGHGIFTETAETLEEWQQLGYDRHSVMADPMFVDPVNGDYRVKSDSPALKLGFKNFDMDNFGLLGDFPEKWGK